MVVHVVSLAAALILVSTCVETTVATQPPFSFSWDKISTYAFPGKSESASALYFGSNYTADLKAWLDKSLVNGHTECLA
jgi:hypothetical protein